MSGLDLALGLDVATGLDFGIGLDLAAGHRHVMGEAGYHIVIVGVDCDPLMQIELKNKRDMILGATTPQA